MLIGVPYVKGEVDSEFDEAQVFKFYESDGDEEGAEVARHFLLPAEGEGWQERVQLMQDAGVDIVLCEVISFDARMALRERGIKIYSGKSGNADELIRQLLDGDMFYYSAGMCTGG